MREVTGKRRRRVFAYRKYLAILDRGTEPLPLPSQRLVLLASEFFMTLGVLG